MEKTDFHLIISAEALKQAKKRAIDEDVHLKDVIEALLTQWASGQIKLKLPKTKKVKD